MGRLLDPDEVHTEAHRDKGYGRTKSRKHLLSQKWEKDSAGEESEEEDGRCQSVDYSSDGRYNDHAFGRKSKLTTVPQVFLNLFK